MREDLNDRPRALQITFVEHPLSECWTRHDTDLLVSKRKYTPNRPMLRAILDSNTSLLESKFDWFIRIVSVVVRLAAVNYNLLFDLMPVWSLGQLTARFGQQSLN